MEKLAKMTTREAVEQLEHELESIRTHPKTGRKMSLERLKEKNEDDYRTYRAVEMAICALARLAGVEPIPHDRVTERRTDGTVTFAGYDPQMYGTPTWINMCTQCITKLAEYEDLEEQGLLLRLPCKIGDTVYVVPSAVNCKLNLINELGENNRVYEQTVSRIEAFEQGYGLVTTCDGLDFHSSKFYGETWFLTRKEAEAKLKELEENSNAQKIITS